MKRSLPHAEHCCPYHQPWFCFCGFPYVRMYSGSIGKANQELATALKKELGFVFISLITLHLELFREAGFLCLLSHAKPH